jgi:hypothetical protein
VRFQLCCVCFAYAVRLAFVLRVFRFLPASGPWHRQPALWSLTCVSGNLGLPECAPLNDVPAGGHAWSAAPAAGLLLGKHSISFGCCLQAQCARCLPNNSALHCSCCLLVVPCVQADLKAVCSRDAAINAQLEQEAARLMALPA